MIGAFFGICIVPIAELGVMSTVKQLCKEAMQYKSMITFTYRGNTANAKSVLSVLGACIKCGDEIEFICDGIDEEEALKALVNAVESGLGE